MSDRMSDDDWLRRSTFDAAQTASRDKLNAAVASLENWRFQGRKFRHYFSLIGVTGKGGNVTSTLCRRAKWLSHCTQRRWSHTVSAAEAGFFQACTICLKAE